MDTGKSNCDLYRGKKKKKYHIMDDLTWRQAEPKGQSGKLSEISNERWSDEKNVEGNSIQKTKVSLRALGTPDEV